MNNKKLINLSALDNIFYMSVLNEILEYKKNKCN